MTDSRPQLSPERFRAVRDLFDEALTTPPDERGAMLDRHCAGDRALREEVESLLSALDRASDEWEESGARQLAGDAMRAAGAWFSDPLAPQTRLGAYVVTRKVGEGGMGAVYEAVRDDETYEGRVAIKTLGRGLADPTLTRRLIRERQILARLQHPNIATLLDGGTTEHGLPYLVMEFVDGEPLDRHCTALLLARGQPGGVDRAGDQHAGLAAGAVDLHGHIERLVAHGAARVEHDAAAADEAPAVALALAPQHDAVGEGAEHEAQQGGRRGVATRVALGPGRGVGGVGRQAGE